MADTGLIGLTDALVKLEDITGPNGRFIRKSLRRILVEIGLEYVDKIKAAIKSDTGKTAYAVNIREGKKKRGVISIMMGVFGSQLTADAFYAGWANFGHRIFLHPIVSKTKGAMSILRGKGLLVNQGNIHLMKKMMGKKRYGQLEYINPKTGEIRRGAKSGGIVEGQHWTEKVKAETTDTQARVVEMLKAELETFAVKK